jgi:hypothetical protein
MFAMVWWMQIFDEVLADLSEAYWAVEYRRVVARMR